MDGDQLLASAVYFLVEGGDMEAAALLLQSSITVDPARTMGSLDRITVRAPRRLYDARSEAWDREDYGFTNEWTQIDGAIKAVCIERVDVEVRGQVVEVTPEWRSEMRNLILGKQVSNQAVVERPIDESAIRVWQGHRFRSEVEVVIAQALDQAGVLFFPNCRARLSAGASRTNREPDFLVCHQGKWGILEVDGRVVHAGRASDDHERDRLFKAHGVREIQRFSHDECLRDARGVVSRFLTLLAAG